MFWSFISSPETVSIKTFLHHCANIRDLSLSLSLSLSQSDTGVLIILGSLSFLYSFIKIIIAAIKNTAKYRFFSSTYTPEQRGIFIIGHTFCYW